MVFPIGIAAWPFGNQVVAIGSIAAAIGPAVRAIEILTGPIENVADGVRTGSGSDRVLPLRIRIVTGIKNPVATTRGTDSVLEVHLTMAQELDSVLAQVELASAEGAGN